MKRSVLKVYRRGSGFTVLELLIATSVFSVLLVVVSAGIISFSHDYYKGITSTKTQVTARSIINDIAQNIQFSATDDITPEISSGLPDKFVGICIKNTLYTFKLNREVVVPSASYGSNQGPYGLIKEIGTLCSAASFPALPTGPLTSSQREMLGLHMRISALKVEPIDNLWRIHVRVAYGDDEVLCSISERNCNNNTLVSDWDNTDIACKSTVGDQFCAISDLVTSVQQRIE